mmetsp:Transcript_31819/g.72623  ORF Transcript_31819/g.72623 Transcript_31819/m.72623 type:complete len:82 (+) Transcript_31819:15-260(+)
MARESSEQVLRTLPHSMKLAQFRRHATCTDIGMKAVWLKKLWEEDLCGHRGHIFRHRLGVGAWLAPDKLLCHGSIQILKQK